MKIFISLLISIFGFVNVLIAQDRAEMLGTAMMQAVQPSQTVRPEFRWQDSVGGIRKATADLLENNQKLSQEYTALNEQAAGVQVQIDQLNKENQELQEAIVARQMELAGPAKSGHVHNDLVLTKKVIAQEKQAVSLLNVKRKNLERRTTLLQLKIKDLELEKRAFFVAQKGSKASASFDGSSELNRLKASLEALRNENVELREKIMDAGPLAPPPSLEDQRIMKEIEVLNAEVLVLDQEKRDMGRRIKERAALTRSLSYKRYLELIARQDELTRKAEELKAKKDDPLVLDEQKEEQVRPEVNSRDWEGEIEKLNEDNLEITKQVDDLRENIAVLEYKIHTLDRYKNRKKIGR